MRSSSVLGTALTATAILIFTPGCEHSASPKPSVAAGTSRATTDAPQAAAEPVPIVSQRCQTLLSSAIEMMQPENMGISAEPQSAVDTLNNWVTDCGGGKFADDPRTLRDKTAQSAGSADPDNSPSGAAQPQPTDDHHDRFSVADIEHVRTCRLLKQCAATVLKKSAKDADRVVGLFDLAVHTVALADPHEPLPAQSLYDIVIIGNGHAEDRAWLFGELLRQCGFDAFILSPKGAGTATPSAAHRWLVGVPVENQILLFDPTLGWPIPSKTDQQKSPSVQHAATLAEASANDGVFRTLDVATDRPYPLKATDLKSLKVQLITRKEFGFPRVRRLESFIAGNRTTTIFVPLEDVGGRPGLISRTAAAGKGFWKREDISVWDYPDRQSERARHLTGQDVQIREIHWLPFEGPLKLELDPKAMQLVTNKSERKQIKARTAQLEGEFATAIRGYLMVQLEEVPPTMAIPPHALPPSARQHAPTSIEVPQRTYAINYRAAEDARFWMATCQLDQGENETAAENFAAYLRGYGARNGVWTVQAALLRGLALGRLQKYALAVQTVNQVIRALPENDIRRATLELFAARWRESRNAGQPTEQIEKPVEKAEKKTPTPKPSPASDKPAAKSDQTKKAT